LTKKAKSINTFDDIGRAEAFGKYLNAQTNPEFIK